MPGPIDLFTIPDADNLAWKLPENLLPVDTATGFTVGLSVFIPMLVFIASLLMGWHVIIGIVQSAYHGRVLGERWHQIWAPLRVVAGFGFLVSVTGSGLAGIHHLERLIYMMGTNSADMIAVASVEHVVKDGHSLTPISAGGRQLAWQVVTGEVCTRIHHQAVERTAMYTGETASSRLPPASGEAVVRPAKKSWVPFGAGTPAVVTGFAWNYGQACGSLTISAPTTEEFGSFGEDRRKAMQTLVEQVRAVDPAGPLADSFRQSGTARIYGDPAMSSDLSHIREWTTQGALVPGLVQQMNAIGDAYDAAVSGSAAAVSASEDRETRGKLVEGVKTHGWTLIGSYYRMMSKIAEKASSYASERPVYREPNPDAWGGYKNEMAVAMDIIRSQNRAETNRLAVSGDDLAAVESDATVLADVINSISHPVLDYMTAYDGWRNDPVGDLIAIGNRLSVGGQTAFAIALAATGAANFWSSTAGAVVEFVMVPGWWAIGLAIVAGSVLSYVLPMMPYIFMIFALGALAMDLVVFAIAGLLWAFVHVRMDGQEFADQAQSFGYHALFSLLLRQPITVLGFLASHAISVVLLNIFLMTWNFAFVGSQGNASIGIIGIVVGFGMMCFIQWHILLRLFGLILELPPRVGAYFGAAIQGWGDTEHGNTVIAGSVGGISAHARPNMPRIPGQKGPKEQGDFGGKGRPNVGGVTAPRGGK
ncbi:DotA/TraY family protein [Mesorhizobium sp.]|uniref:DotA/TraY family protein n=1 Tax=Mesorhizobium sp. TaxID=1871066 RepID=UPI0025CED9A6|nr:DotA/TraY family protein [Mesorhizobium sp.]